MNQVESIHVSQQGRTDARWEHLERLRATSRMVDAVIDEVRGRRIRIGERWLVDFASCNYLGFDHDPEIIDSVQAYLTRWGTHPSWSRLIGNVRPYLEIEEELTELLRAPDALILPTITHIHAAVIPLLAGRGHVLVDARAHRTIYDGCAVARGQGVIMHRFHAEDIGGLEELLGAIPATRSRLVCMDGVNSMTGNVPDLAAVARVCRRYDALLYVDDAHGFGVLGEQPDDANPYGYRGNSIVRHAGETYDNLILVGGFSKAYSSLLAFLILPTRLKNYVKVAAAPYLYSGPPSTASLATVLAGFRVNRARGDALRADLAAKTRRVLDHVHGLGLHTPNRTGLPIVQLPLARADTIEAVGEFLFDHGMYVTLAPYPLVPRDEVGFRLQVTAANGEDEIEELTETLTLLADRFDFQPAGPEHAPGSDPAR